MPTLASLILEHLGPEVAGEILERVAGQLLGYGSNDEYEYLSTAIGQERILRLKLAFKIARKNLDLLSRTTAKPKKTQSRHRGKRR